MYLFKDRTCANCGYGFYLDENGKCDMFTESDEVMPVSAEECTWFYDPDDLFDSQESWFYDSDETVYYE